MDVLLVDGVDVLLVEFQHVPCKVVFTCMPGAVTLGDSGLCCCCSSPTLR